jgi:hypothetical protein
MIKNNIMNLLKQINFVLALLLSNILVYGQEQDNSKSKYVLGGSLSFSAQNKLSPNSLNTLNSINGISLISAATFKYSRFVFEPYLGKQLDKNTIFGIQCQFSHQAFVDPFGGAIGFIGTAPVETKRIKNQFRGGVFTRYNFLAWKKVNLFIQPNAQFAYLMGTEYENGVEMSVKTAKFIELGMGMGLYYDISHKLRVLLRTNGLSYLAGSWDKSVSNGQFYELNLDLNFSNMFLGCEYRL